MGLCGAARRTALPAINEEVVIINSLDVGIVRRCDYDRHSPIARIDDPRRQESDVIKSELRHVDYTRVDALIEPAPSYIAVFSGVDVVGKFVDPPAPVLRGGRGGECEHRY